MEFVSIMGVKWINIDIDELNEMAFEVYTGMKDDSAIIAEYRLKNSLNSKDYDEFVKALHETILETIEEKSPEFCVLLKLAWCALTLKDLSELSYKKILQYVYKFTDIQPTKEEEKLILKYIDYAISQIEC